MSLFPIAREEPMQLDANEIFEVMPVKQWMDVVSAGNGEAVGYMMPIWRAVAKKP